MVDVLKEILYYRQQKGWSEYQLAEESGLTQSTISSWYRKNMIPSIPSLEKVCNAFGITLSQLRRWLDLFQTQKEEWLGVLSSMETSGLSFLKVLLTQTAYSDFASAFVRRFTKSFLQSHKNPAPYCQQVFGP